MASTLQTEQPNTETVEKQAPLLNDRNFFASVIRRTVQDFLEAEMTSFLDAESRERTPGRQGYRSGHRPRTMNTRVGRLHFDLPCERSGQFHTRLFANYQRSELAFVLTLQEMYLHRVSTRRVKAITETMCSLPISSSEVSRLTAKLDETLSEWRRRRCTQAYFALIVDARYEHVRANHRVDNQAVITVTGISAKTGQREILGIYVVNTESATSWGEVFRDLLARGLSGVESVTSDAHEDLVAAMMKYYQGAVWQRCQRHFSINARDLVHKKDRKELTQDLRSIFDPCDREHAQDRVQEVIAKWSVREPELATWLEKHIEPTLTCFQYPPSFRARVRTTNMQERFNEEWKRRSQVIRIFPNSESCLRLMTAMAMEQNEVWAEQQPYLDIRQLEAWKQNQTAGVSATESGFPKEPKEGDYCREKSA